MRRRRSRLAAECFDRGASGVAAKGTNGDVMMVHCLDEIEQKRYERRND